MFVSKDSQDSANLSLIKTSGEFPQRSQAQDERTRMQLRWDGAVTWTQKNKLLILYSPMRLEKV